MGVGFDPINYFLIRPPLFKVNNLNFAKAICCYFFLWFSVIHHTVCLHYEAGVVMSVELVVAMLKSIKRIDHSHPRDSNQRFTIRAPSGAVAEHLPAYPLPAFYHSACLKV